MGQHKYLVNETGFYYKEITYLILETENKHVVIRKGFGRVERVNKQENHEL